MLMHWNGKIWEFVPVPELGAGQSMLNAVSARARDDVWAVGVRSIPQVGTTDNTTGKTTGSAVEYRTIALHWNGTAWLNTNSDLGGFRGVLAMSRNDVWAAGNTLVEHWDGVGWRVVPIPNLGPGGSVDKLAAVAGNNITGESEVWGIMSPEGLLFSRWDGQEWSVVPGPTTSARSARIQGTAASSQSEVWVVGRLGGGPWVGRFIMSACH